MKVLAKLGAMVFVSAMSLATICSGVGNAATLAVDCARTSIVREELNPGLLRSVTITNKCSRTIGLARMHVFAGSTLDWTERSPLKTAAGESRTRYFTVRPQVSPGTLVCGEWLDTAGRNLGRDCITM